MRFGLCLFFAAALAMGVLLWPRHLEGQVGPSAGRLIRASIPAPSLDGNLLGDPTEQPVAIYLPPDYDREADRRYPVLYLLHGIGGSPEDWLNGGYQGLSLPSLMDSLISAGAIQPMIVVMPNGTNGYGGSFYENSPVTGGWEDWIWRDVVSWIDATYRTIAHVEGRGISGHSMGGYGGIRMGMHHPDVFSAVWAMNPCCLAMVGDASLANPVWRRMHEFRTRDDLIAALREGDFYPLATVAVASVYSPCRECRPLLVELPARLEGDTVRPAEPAYSRWIASFPVARARSQAENLKRLRGLRFDTSFEDEFSHIPLGARMLADTLAVLEVPHVFEMYEGDHRNRMRERLTKKVLPFFSELLAPDAPKAGARGSF